ncbi:hypothetical protein JCM17092_30180 [Haloplanus litoreus]
MFRHLPGETTRVRRLVRHSPGTTAPEPPRYPAAIASDPLRPRSGSGLTETNATKNRTPLNIPEMIIEEMVIFSEYFSRVDPATAEPRVRTATSRYDATNRTRSRAEWVAVGTTPADPFGRQFADERRPHRVLGDRTGAGIVGRTIRYI